MERIHREPYNFNELFSGNWELFQKALTDRKTVFVYDNDGIFSDTSKEVFKEFSKKYGLNVKPADITDWNYLTMIAETAGFDENVVIHAEDDFYNPEILKRAPAVYGIKHIISRTLLYYGPERNYILTSRNPEFKDVTLSWFSRKFPGLPLQNILIRDSKEISGEDFKVKKLEEIASRNPWVVFIDDGQQFIKHTLEAGIKNCLVVNIPIGKINPDFTHERLFVFKRYPDDLQAIYPLYDAIDRVLNSRTVFLNGK